MGRARNIKPSFFSNEQLAEVSAEARLLFAGLWTIADREGRLEDRPKRIRAELFPYDNWDCDHLLSELARIKVITRYTVDGRNCIWVNSFLRHQNPHPKEKDSTIPPLPCNYTASKRKEISSNLPAVKRCGQEMLNHESMNHESPIHESMNHESMNPAAAGDSYPESFDSFWNAYPKRAGKRRGKEKTFRLWKAILAAERDSVTAAAKNYAMSSEAQEGFARDPERFLAADWWKDWLDPAESPESNLPPLVVGPDFNYLEYVANYHANGGQT